MPRPSARLVEAQLVPTNALVASAMLFEGSKAQSVFRPHAAWQQEAWRQYSITPELSFAAGWIGNALSRCLLEPGETGPNGTSVSSKDAQTAQALGEFFGGDHGQAQMLQALGIHLTVAGEAYIVGRAVAGTTVWSIASVIEMTVAGGTWTINYGAGLTPVILGSSDTVIRVWRPHPVRSMEAWSPVLTLLPTLTEIEMLTRHIFAQATSRVAGAGVWVVPSELEFPGSAATDNKAEGLQKLLGSTMSLSLDDPGNASSLVPIIVTAPGAMITDIKDGLIHFWSPFDEAAVNTRATAISRFCVGMDLPPEVIQGFSSRTSSTGGGASTVSHWTSWMIEESAIKLHIEPLLELIANAVVIGYMRPVTKNPKASLVTNTNTLKLQPDRSKEALELADRGKIKDEALLLYSGMMPEDAMTEEGYKRWLLGKMAGASATPEQLAFAFKALGIPNVPDSVGEQPVHPGSNQGDSPSLLEHPSGQGPPDQPFSRQQMLLAVSEPMVLRALERVGNRLRNDGVKPPGVPAREVYLTAKVNGNATEYLSGAWEYVSTCSNGLAESEDLKRVLNAYVENLLTQQVPHDREALGRYLTLIDGK